LADAATLKDRIIAGEVAEIPAADTRAANALVDELVRLGANAEVA
jgi:hypothetical protein